MEFSQEPRPAHLHVRWLILAALVQVGCVVLGLYFSKKHEALDARLREENRALRADQDRMEREITTLRLDLTFATLKY